jgi:hypothetical protein
MPSMRQLMESVLESEILEESNITPQQVISTANNLDLMLEKVNINGRDELAAALTKFLEVNAQ